jgi:hypothetical protein
MALMLWDRRLPALECLEEIPQPALQSVIVRNCD